MVNVYGRRECVQCDQTKKILEKHGIDYEYHDIDLDEFGRKLVEQSGRTQLPLVVVKEEKQVHMWHGFSPDKIKALAS